jgi:endothelin-converting enzyme
MARTFFKDCNDHETLNLVDKEPVLLKIKELGGWPVMETVWNEDDFDWQEFIDKMYENGFVQNYLIFFFLSPDPDDASRYMAEISQYIQRDYHQGYFKLLKVGLKHDKIKAYYKYMVDYTVLLGADETKAKAEMLDALNFEIALTGVS